MIHSTAPKSLDGNPTLGIQIFSELLISVTIHRTIYFSYTPWVNMYLVFAYNRIQSKQMFSNRMKVGYAPVNTNNYTWAKTKHQNSFLCMPGINKYK